MVTLETLIELGVLSELDRALAETLGRIADERDERVLLAAALASSAVQNGHTCVELARVIERPVYDEAGETVVVSYPEVGAWLEALRSSRLVAHGAQSEKQPRPLVLGSGSRVYLARYFEYERRLAAALLGRVGGGAHDIDAVTLQRGLERLFPEGSPGAKEQRLAAVLALSSRLSVISGGPGTGKTFTVAKILVLLQEQALAKGRELARVELLAPTGKAAQRLGEALRKNLEALGHDPRIADGIPKAASTIHRALKYQPRTPTRFRHHRENPLIADLVVVDEASMVDLALMAKLVDAVPEGARLVLLGDKDQLASVEAGSILADLYAGSPRGFSAAGAERIERLTGTAPASGAGAPSLSDGMVELVTSHRFREGGGGIAELARAVNAGDAARALAVLGESAFVTLEPLPEPAELARALGPIVEEKLGRLGSASVDEKLALLDGFRLLCAHRRGPYGVETINELIALHLRKRGLLEASGDFYDGRPVIVTANDYQVELYNGDVGVIGRESSSDVPSALFPGPTGRRSVALALLPPHETAFAMSVHKAQGSEFDEVLLLLGDRPSPLLTRELVYTAVTRARKRVRIFAAREILASAVASRVQRASGLRERLWGVE
ncbi:MAG TPA: exodeoxyribonuclease V subunit alpha [Polyangiaceae bacterium]|nr:exodeoxyribonuclease V subunit alpha [Polyangiaceae bacterium]